jgi:hypothetical protein
MQGQLDGLIHVVTENSESLSAVAKSLIQQSESLLAVESFQDQTLRKSYKKVMQNLRQCAVL